MLHREKLAGAAKAGLNFAGDSRMRTDQIARSP
jgi:hypothetical protein